MIGMSHQPLPPSSRVIALEPRPAHLIIMSSSYIIMLLSIWSHMMIGWICHLLSFALAINHSVNAKWILMSYINPLYWLQCMPQVLCCTILSCTQYLFCEFENSSLLRLISTDPNPPLQPLPGPSLFFLNFQLNEVRWITQHASRCFFWVQ